jgi:hypothetical protein
MLNQNIFGDYHRQRRDLAFQNALELQRQSNLAVQRIEARVDPHDRRSQLGLGSAKRRANRLEEALTNCTNCGAPRRGCGCDYCGA